MQEVVKNAINNLIYTNILLRAPLRYSDRNIYELRQLGRETAQKFSEGKVWMMFDPESGDLIGKDITEENKP